MRKIAILFLTVLSLGCWEAKPDNDTLDDLRDSIASVPVEIRSVMGKFAANRFAYGYLRTYGKDVQLGTIACLDNKDNQAVGPTHIPIHKMWSCLHTMQTTTYLECLDLILQEFNDDYPEAYCEWVGYQMNLRPDEVPDEFKAEFQTTDSIVHTLLGPPPPLEIQLMLMGLPGMMGPRGMICPQGASWACAPNPLDGEPTPSTSAASGGGDQ